MRSPALPASLRSPTPAVSGSIVMKPDGATSSRSEKAMATASPVIPGKGAVKLTDLRTYSASWPLPKLLILRSSADGYRLQNTRILLNLTVPFWVFWRILPLKRVTRNRAIQHDQEHDLPGVADPLMKCQVDEMIK